MLLFVEMGEQGGSILVGVVLEEVVEMDGRRKGKEETVENPKICSSGAAARANMTFARAHSILEGSTRADLKLKLGDSF